MENYSLTNSKVEYRPKEWCGYLRYHGTGYGVFWSQGWEREYFRINSNGGFRDEIAHVYAQRFEPEAHMMRVGERFFFRTNAFLHRTDRCVSRGRNIERNNSDLTGIILDKEELHHLTISEDYDALQIYTENFFNKCNNKQPILVPFSNERRESNPNDIKFANILCDICKVNMDFYKHVRDIEHGQINFEDLPLHILSNNSRLSPEEVLQLACIFSNTHYDFNISRIPRSWNLRLGPYALNKDKWIGIWDGDYKPKNPYHISLEISDGFCTKDNIDKVLKYFKKIHDYMHTFSGSTLINAIKTNDFTFFYKRVKERNINMSEQQVVDGAKNHYNKYFKQLDEDYEQLQEAERKLKELANSLDQQQESIDSKETVLQDDQVVKKDESTELPVFAVIIKPINDKEGDHPKEFTEGKEIFLTKEAYINLEADFPGSLHAIPMTEEGWINYISEKAYDCGVRIAISEKASGKKLVSKYRGIIPNNKLKKIDVTGIQGGLYEAIRSVLELEDECKEFEAKIYEEIIRKWPKIKK